MPEPFAPAYTPPTSSPIGNGVLDSLLGGVQSLGSLGLSFFQENNRNTESLRSLQYQRDVALASRGFTAGGVDVAPGVLGLARMGAAAPVSFPSFPIGGGGGGDPLATLKPYIPLVILALVASRMLR